VLVGLLMYTGLQDELLLSYYIAS